MTNEVIISMERYQDLLYKEFVFEMKRNEKMNSNYKSIDEIWLFRIPVGDEVE